MRSGDLLVVSVEGEDGGVATFRMPDPQASSATAILTQAFERMLQLHSYRQHETLTSGGPIVRSTYSFVAPDSFEAHSREPGGGSDTVWIGEARYRRVLPSGPWQVERGGPAPTVPSFIWDSFAPYLDARLIGHGSVDGVRTDVVAFFGGDTTQPVWFKLWIDGRGLVRKAEMRAEGHFMGQRYYGFDDPIEIKPPPAANP
jgi:hypothetical protein